MHHSCLKGILLFVVLNSKRIENTPFFGGINITKALDPITMKKVTSLYNCYLTQSNSFKVPWSFIIVYLFF